MKWPAQCAGHFRWSTGGRKSGQPGLPLQHHAKTFSNPLGHRVGEGQQLFGIAVAEVHQYQGLTSVHRSARCTTP